MIALLYFLFFVVYLLISVWVIRIVYRFANRRYQKGWAGGLLAAFIMYNLVFWDWIPVLVMHKYYCETEAGFWVYKTPEKWVKEHPEVIGQDWGDQTQWKTEMIDPSYEHNVSRYWVSPEIYYESSQQHRVAYDISRREYKIVDANTGDVLVRTVNFGRSGQYKLWLRKGSCSDEINTGSGKELNKLILIVKGDKK